MGAASQSEVEAMLQRAVGLYAAAYIRGISATDNIASLTEAATEAVFGDRAANIAASVENWRGLYAAVLARADIQPLLDTVLRADLDRIGSNQRIPQSLLPLGDLHRDFVDNNRTVKRRAITRGAATAGGSNVGDGWFYRLTVDFRNELIQSDPRPVGYTARVTADSSTLPVGRENWRIEADSAIGKDTLTNSFGFAESETMSTVTSLTSGLLLNPSFDAGGSSSTNKVPSWTDTAGAAITASYVSIVDGDGTAGGTGTNAIAAFEGATTGRYLSVATGTAIEIQQVRPLQVTSPFVAGVWARKVGSPTGNLVLKVGTRTKTISYASDLTTSWQFFALDPQDWWPRRWVRAGDGEGVVVALDFDDPASTNQIHVDSVTLAPMTRVNQTYLAAGAGATPWQIEDTIAYTDSETTDPNSLQGALAYIYNRYLPSVPVSSTVTAAGGRTLTFAASGQTITASSGDFTSEDFVVGQTLTVAGTSSNNGTFIITAVTATVITVASGIVDEGPLSATATLNGAPSIADPTVS